MDVMQTVGKWDQSLRDGDWELARSMLADDATYTASGIDCRDADEIVDLMRSFKGQLPDVQVIEWDVRADDVIARLRQPAFGDDADWYQVLDVHDEKVARLRDFGSKEDAIAATA